MKNIALKGVSTKRVEWKRKGRYENTCTFAVPPSWCESWSRPCC